MKNGFAPAIVCAAFAGAVVTSTPVLARCAGVPPFLEIARTDPEAIVLRVKIAEHATLKHETAAGKFRTPIAIADVLESYRSSIGKQRVRIAGAINGSDNPMPMDWNSSVGTEWVFVGSTNPRLPEIDLWLSTCSGNALEVKGRVAEGFVRKWLGHDGKTYHGWSWRTPEQISLDQLRFELRLR